MKKTSIIIAFLTAVISAFVLLFLIFFGNIAAFVLENNTGYYFDYSKWGDGLFDKSIIYDLSIKDRSGNFAVKSSKTIIDVDLSSILKERNLVFSCDAENVRIDIKSAGNEFLLVAFNPAQKYADISFIFSDNGRIIQLSEINAVSDAIKVSGGVSFDRQKDYIVLDISISLSPEITEQFPDIIKDNALYPDENGWYGTVINFKGNAKLLRAIYSLTNFS